MNQASTKKETMEEEFKELAIELLPTKTLTPHPDNEALWATKDKDIEALAKTIKKTKVIDPLLVHESLSGTVVLSGHSRLAVAKKLGIKHVPCRKVSGLSETEQLLWIIAFNTGHATDKKRLLKAALYCAEKNKDIDVLAMLDFCGAGEDAERWAEALDRAIQIIMNSGKNKPRIKKTAQDSAGDGIQALEATIKKSEAKTGTQNASAEKHSSDFSSQKPIGDNDLQEKTPPKTDDFKEPVLGFVTPLAESFVVPVSEIPKISEAAATKPVAGMKATVKSLNRDMYAAGLLSTVQAKFAMETLLALAEGEPMPEAPSKAIIENLQRQLAEAKEMADDNGKAFNIAEGVVNKLLRQAVQAYLSQTRRDGYVTVDAMRLRDELVNEAKFDLMSMNPDDLQASLEAAMRQEN